MKYIYSYIINLHKIYSDELINIFICVKNKIAHNMTGQNKCKNITHSTNTNTNTNTNINFNTYLDSVLDSILDSDIDSEIRVY